MPRRSDNPSDALTNLHVAEAVKRGLIEVKGDRITYNLATTKTYGWGDPEEWVRARTLAFLVLERGYPINRIRTEVQCLGGRPAISPILLFIETTNAATRISLLKTNPQARLPRIESNGSSRHLETLTHFGLS